MHESLAPNFFPISKYFRINERIRVPTVRIIDENDEQIGIMAIEKAIEMARSKELDLVEVSPTARPPVCKILDFGKFLYRQKKQEQKQKKGSKQTEVKSLRISVRTDTHDLEVKANKIKDFIDKRNLVKISLVMRGRELSHLDLGFDKIKKFAEMLKPFAMIQEGPKKQGNTIFLLVAPL